MTIFWWQLIGNGDQKLKCISQFSSIWLSLLKLLLEFLNCILCETGWQKISWFLCHILTYSSPFWTISYPAASLDLSPLDLSPLGHCFPSNSNFSTTKFSFGHNGELICHCMICFRESPGRHVMLQTTFGLTVSGIVDRKLPLPKT